MSNPIHSTSAKSVLPMLAMRGLATGLCARVRGRASPVVPRSGRCACGALAGRVARGMVDGTDLVRRTGCAGRDPQAHRQGGTAHQRLGYSADGVGAGRASILYMVACIARKIFRELAGVVRRACPWPGRPEHPDGRGRGRGVSCALEAGGSPCPDRKPLCCGRGRGGPCRRLWGTAAGVLFAFEEMKSRRDTSLIVAACASAIGAHLMIRIVFGMGRILPFAGFEAPPAVLFLDRGAGRRRLWGARRGIQQDPAVASR